MTPTSSKPEELADYLVGRLRTYCARNSMYRDFKFKKIAEHRHLLASLLVYQAFR